MVSNNLIFIILDRNNIIIVKRATPIMVKYPYKNLVLCGNGIVFYFVNNLVIEKNIAIQSPHPPAPHQIDHTEVDQCRLRGALSLMSILSLKSKFCL